METEKKIEGAILLEYFSGKLSGKQKVEVETWIAQSEANEQLAYDIHYIYYSTEILRTIRETKTMEALRNVHRKIVWRRLKTVGRWAQRIAALLFIPLFCTMLYRHFLEKTIEQVELRTSPGMVATATLPDGSKVWLNADSRITYPSEFIGNCREVNLDGEAYFSVHKHRNRPFIVHTSAGAKVEVLGTEFNLEAYRKDELVNATLVSGSVRFTYPSNDHGESSVVLKPDESVRYNRTTKQMVIKTINTQAQTAWKDGLVIFRNTPFKDALRILEKRFNAQFDVKNETLYEHSYTGRFDTQQLPLILEHFRLSSGIRYRIIEPKRKEDAVQEKTIVEIF
ncbi:FecR family protein [Tannerella sp.]|uniref:FecR family protein n=1 Tax=Tannerella sp. TaxID=2382127 RepID=UPI0026DC8296|nr:FecR domain-containing protein [Tannerella sp.]MDO4703846.1 FecR domain-containing protein [Tannerella sp.]